MSNYKTEERPLEDNSGIAFPVEKKGDKWPDLRGRVKVNGKEMQISMWKRIGKTGNQFFSLKFSEPYVKQDSQTPHVDYQPAKHDSDSQEVPF